MHASGQLLYSIITCILRPSKVIFRRKTVGCHFLQDGFEMGRNADANNAGFRSRPGATYSYSDTMMGLLAPGNRTGLTSRDMAAATATAKLMPERRTDDLPFEPSRRSDARTRFLLVHQSASGYFSFGAQQGHLWRLSVLAPRKGVGGGSVSSIGICLPALTSTSSYDGKDTDRRI